MSGPKKIKEKKMAEKSGIQKGKMVLQGTVLTVKETKKKTGGYIAKILGNGDVISVYTEKPLEFKEGVYVEIEVTTDFVFATNG